MTYLVRFSRYNRTTCASRKSGIVWINANSFAEAFTIATHRLQGMIDADPECDYSITVIDGSRDQRGDDCEGGILLWETVEELTARVGGA